MTASGKNKKPLLILILLSSVFFFSAAPESGRLAVHTFDGRNYISFMDVVRTFNIRFTFDMLLQRGRIYHETHYAVITYGFSVILADGRLIRSDYEITRKKGMLLIPENAAEEVIKSFFPGIVLDRSADRLTFSMRAASPYKPSDNAPSDRERGVPEPITFIVIDPGHGGKDPGALGKSGLREKKIVLQISLELEKKLKTRFSNLKIILLRRDDRFLELADRTKAANKYLKKGHNGIFISVHINASVSPRASGFETYFLSQNASNDEARKTAALENDVIVLEEKKGGGFEDTDYIEAMMLTTQIQKESSLLAESVHKGLTRNVRSLKPKGVKKADFFVLRGSLMPAVLVEAGYITNSRDAGYIKQKSGQQAIAEGITDGVESFLKEYNKLLK